MTPTQTMPMPNRPVYRVPRNPAPVERPHAVRNQCRFAIGMFCLCVAVVLVAAPSTLRYGFPVGALLMAIFLFVRSRVAYIQFVCWLYFLSPFLRRLVDFRTSFMAVSPLLLGPILATGVAGIVLFTRGRELARPGAISFACALAGIFFGTVVGFTRYAPIDVGRAFLNWVPPVLFAYFLYAERERYPEYQRALTRAILWGTLFMAVYGIVQFFLLLPWDLQWLVDIKSGVFGEPVPMKIRAFGTMNAPATYASYMMAGALLVFCLKTRWRTIVVPLAFVALLLTSSRASWVGFGGGVLYLGFCVSRRARLELLGGLLACILLAAGAAVAPIQPLQSQVSARIKSMIDPHHDISYNARLNGHLEALEALSVEPFGEGMGSTDVDHATDMNDDRIGPHDSTMLECLYALGGPGSLLYLLGIGYGMLRVGSLRMRDPFVLGMTAIFFAYMTEGMLNSIFVGVLGFMVWTSAGMALAAAERQRSSWKSVRA